LHNVYINGKKPKKQIITRKIYRIENVKTKEQKAMNLNLDILIDIVWSIILLVALFIGYRLFVRWLNNYSKRTDMSPEAKNGLMIVIRLGALAGGFFIILAALGVSSQFIVSLSAIIGAAIGFASQQTIGNFVSGIYLILTRPFRVGDYIRLGSSGGTEGIVKEITISYTKIRTSDKTQVIISNLEVLGEEIKNYRIKTEKTASYRYGIELAFEKSFSTEEIISALEKIANRYKDQVIETPTYEQTSLTNLAKKYSFFIRVKKPEKIFDLSSNITKEITQELEKSKTQKTINI